MNTLKDKDLEHLKTCLDLAKEALEAGDKPFGSILVNANNEVIATARNRVNEINQLAHPEFELAAWAIKNMSAEERKQSTMYTSGEHCPMCSGALAWSEIGNVVYLSSGAQLSQWLQEMNVPEAPIHFLPIEKIAKNVVVKGPTSGELLKAIKELHRKSYQKNK